MNIHLL